jgi:hypothetical protein
MSTVIYDSLFIHSNLSITSDTFPINDLRALSSENNRSLVACPAAQAAPDAIIRCATNAGKIAVR